MRSLETKNRSGVNSDKNEITIKSVQKILNGDDKLVSAVWLVRDKTDYRVILFRLKSLLSEATAIGKAQADEAGRASGGFFLWHVDSNVET